MWSVFFVGLVVGVMVTVSLEVVGLLLVLNRLNRRIKRESLAASNPQSQPPLDFAYNKQGTVWVLESEKAPAPKEQKRKKDSPLEVSPTRKHAKIVENNLVFIHSDASRTTIPLKGCIIEAVSATNLPSRKWTKRFPIRVESKTSPIYNGSKTIYLYLETSWEKESWCQSLRLASFEDKEKIRWFAKLNEDFRAYLASLNAGYPSFMKPSLGFSAEPMDKGGKFDGSSSKVRLFWRKLSKMAKPGMESKGVWTSQTAREDRKICEKQHPFQDSVTKKVPNSSTDENMTFQLQQGFPRTVSQSASVASDADSEQDKFSFDEGTLCWNFLISRIFFDIKGNAGLKSSIQARIQRTLSNMRTPSYIGEVICTDLDIGNIPPYIHAMRLLPTDMNEVWAFEVDAEYSGGILLDVETRLEVSEQDFQKGLVDSNSESNSTENVSSDLLEGFEHFGKHLNLPEEDEVDPKVDGLKGSKVTPSYASRWKSVVNSVAKQVSQVPLSLSIRVASLRGTLRLYIKPPPSDQLWFGFTSMPDIEFDLESSVGEYKITSGHIALFLISRFKAAIRETMVLPNCESACIPFMLAEKDDWVPRKDAPFIWLNQEATADNNIEAKENCRKTSNSHPESKNPKPKEDSSREPVADSEAMPSSSSSGKSRSLQDLRTPLLATDEPHETHQQNREETSDSVSVSRSLTESERQSDVGDDNDSRPKKTGRRARMMDLTKKMGEKLEEKKRHIEKGVGTLLRK
ncbi:pentatricopeptide repeat-containing protein [Hibiscus syriacus]|uniref:Pentatricopeptide repeat-containing protein n=1 Tax=Hibiscus syriacus TaxID=106335 RepID=A0A6A2WUK4_HIBSY|nr:uncharacterized protein LOC120191526 [Hibiscus syriacus]KAE8658720.1 pentatricopeptide repeat-containing protein [Hibiscus syriacus]